MCQLSSNNFSLHRQVWFKNRRAKFRKEKVDVKFEYKESNKVILEEKPGEVSDNSKEFRSPIEHLGSSPNPQSTTMMTYRRDTADHVPLLARPTLFHSFVPVNFQFAGFQLGPKLPRHGSLQGLNWYNHGVTSYEQDLQWLEALSLVDFYQHFIRQESGEACEESAWES